MAGLAAYRQQLSDGYAYYDDGTQTLFHYPSADDPGTEHFVRLLPPLAGNANAGWAYFFQGDRAMGGR